MHRSRPRRGFIQPLSVGLILAISLLSPVVTADKANAQVADVVYENGKIYTVNEAQPWAEAVAIKDGKFVKVGLDEDVRGMIGDSTDVVDLGGRFVMPGIHDTHVHPPLVYVFEEGGDLLFPETLSKEEIQDTLRKYVDTHPDEKDIRGEKWATSLFPGGKAHKSFLDEVVSDRPVMLLDETGHNAVANSKALEHAGVTKDTPQPEGGVIDKDPVTGEPTGYLSETGIGVVNKIFSKPDLDAYYRDMSRALEEMRV